MAGEDLLSSPSDLKLTSRRGFAKLTLAGLLATTCQSALAESAKASSSENEGRIPPIQHSNKRFEFRLADGGEREAVPLGNGVVGTSLWISKAGYIEFYVARTDVFTEIDRNVHLGKVKIGITPNPFVDSDVTCCLNAETGHLEIDARGLRGQFVASVFVDKETGAIVVRMADRAALTFTVEPITWRLSAAAPQDDAVLPGMPEAQDVVTEFDGCIVVYHRNASSCVPQLAAIQVPNFEHTVPDPYVDRIFGFAIYSLTGELAKGGVLRFTKTGLSTIVVNTSSEQEPSLDAWLSKIVARAPSLSAIERMSKRTAEWWKFYWQQSWVNVGAQDLKGSIVAQEGRYQDMAKSEVVDHAYTFSKYMTACASGGTYPISYNGSLFSMMPTATPPLQIHQIVTAYDGPVANEPTQALNPDSKIWNGSGFLWQNTRLSYQSMIARGEFEAIRRSLFCFYNRFAELDRARARLYWEASGQHNTEMTLACGLQPGAIYGMDRSGKKPYSTDNRWGGAVEISPGLERLFMMLEVFDYTDDRSFLKDEIVPYAHDLFDYIFTRFRKRANEKVVLHPLHAVETYWDVANPMPTVAGMRACLSFLVKLGRELVDDIEKFEQYLRLTPDLPADEGGLLPCLKPLPKRMNVETPELYALHPFRLFGVGKASIEVAKESFARAMEVSGCLRPYTRAMSPSDASYAGWQQVGMNAALLGNRALAGEILLKNSSLHNQAFRFPAMWGPVYDALPDVAHGANILSQVQLMLMQCNSLAEGGEIYLLPAWPLDWNVSFKLHAPGKTVVEIEYRDRRFRKVSVTPSNRSISLVFPVGFDGLQYK